MHRLRFSPLSFTRSAQRGRLLIPFLALLFLSAWGRMASAATLNVPTTTYPTIQAAVNAAQNGDTVLIADGTYSGDGNRDIDFNGKNITVTSQHGAASTIIDCGGSSSANHRGFYLHSGETGAFIGGLTIKNGYEDNGDAAIYGGGGINNSSGGTISHCVITGNTASSEGGGIYNSGGTINNCTISNNTAGNGGGLCNYNGSSGSQVAVTGCTLTDNMATASGGGIYDLNDGVGTITLVGCVFSGNVAVNGGGINNINNGGTVSMTNCTLTGNTASDGSGGGNGGGINNSSYDSGTIAVTNCLLTENTAGSTGGGINNSNEHTNGIVTIINCTLDSNTAGAGGGGICNVNNGTFDTGAITVTNCTFIGNTANYEGGGIVNSNSSSGTITVTNCTLTRNAEIGNTTMPGSGGGGVYNSSMVALTNDILYGDTGGEIVGVEASATYCDVQGGYPGTGNIDVDPLFVYAAGGNLHLQPGSPCLGAGTSTGAPTTDKDGNTRPSPPSIGAYEMATSHTHLLWNNSDGRVMLWSIAADGSFTLNGFGPYTDNAPGNVWHATAVATGPDGLSHLLWNNTDGRVMLWTVDDAGNFTLAGYGPYTDNAPGNVWHATAVSVGPDNVVHLLWNNTDHRVMLWNVAQDFSFTLAGYGPYTDNSVSNDPGNLWSAVALATGTDNLSRIVWNNVDGRVMLWNVDSEFNFNLAGYGPYTDNAPQNKWSAVGVSMGPDNVTHLLWSNTDRRAMFWNVAQDFSFTLAGYGPYTDNAPQNLWSAQALATGPDGLSHILWNNTDYRAMLWGIDSAFSFSVAGYGPYTDNAPGNLWSVTAVSAGP